MDSPDQFEKLTVFVFRYFDQQQKGHVPATVLGNMLRSLGQVWSFSELLEVMGKQGERDVTLAAFQTLAKQKRATEAKALKPSSKKKAEARTEAFVPSLSDKEVRELRVCFSLLDPEDTKVCSLNDIAQILTCLGERLSYSDVQQLLILERLEGKEYLTFNEFTRLCARI